MSSLKYVIFFLTLVIGVPFGTKMAKKNPKVEDIVFFFMMFFTVVTITINFVSREHFRGTSRGFEIGLVDIAMLIILQLIKDRKHHFPTVKLPPGLWLYIVFFFFCWISIVNSAPGYVVNSYFEIWKMIRMYIYFWVVYNYINSWEKFDKIMKFIAIIIIYITFTVLKQKYMEGRFQCPGPFPHQNSLVMYLIVFNSLVFSYLLNRKGVKLWFWLTVYGMGAICIISTLSRAGMVFFVLASITVWFFSFIAGFSAKKIGITFILVVCATIGILQAMDSIIERFETAPEESGLTRIALARAAVAMANDKTFGIGLNNFGVKINPPYSYGADVYAFIHNDRTPPPDYEEKNGLVETAYLSIAAETGWHNLGVYLLFLLTFFFMNFKNYIKLKKSEYRFFATGLIGGLFAIYLESTLEWVLRQTNNFYQLMFVFALIGAMTKIYKRDKLESRRVINATE
ncbi:MAG: O-antigen ligase family protein [Candidatus Cloacimonetes bacterium]|nr:O-antigen ligase family protein [Candidatus Cloacimonadota bacterium]